MSESGGAVGEREDVEQAYFDGYKAGLANEVDDWNAPDDRIRQYAAEYARLSVNEGGVAPVEPQEPR